MVYSKISTVVVDLDNTIIIYDTLFAEEYKNRYGCDLPVATKTSVKDHVYRNNSPSVADNIWQTLQAICYGKSILKAKVAEGFYEFAEVAQALGIKLIIVSHKTSKAYHSDFDVDLIEFSKNFLTQKRVPYSEIYFEESKSQKIARINKLSPDCIVDDLEEIIKDTDKSIKLKLWYSSENRSGTFTWHTITELISLLSVKDFGDEWSVDHLSSNTRNPLLKITTPKESYVVKIFSKHRSDRLKREQLAIKGLREVGYYNIPEVFFVNSCSVVMGFIQGHHPSIFGKNETKALIDLFDKTAGLKHDAYASDSCRTIREHIEKIEKRFINIKWDRVRELNGFDVDQFKTEFEKVIKITEKQSLKEDKPLVDEDLVFSHGDLSLNNTIINNNGDVYFLDFESSGMDDPARVISNLLLHPKMKFEGNLISDVVNHILNMKPKVKREVLARLDIVYLLALIEWILIALNPFSNDHTRAHNITEEEVLKERVHLANNFLLMLKREIHSDVQAKIYVRN